MSWWGHTPRKVLVKMDDGTTQVVMSVWTVDAWAAIPCLTDQAPVRTGGMPGRPVTIVGRFSGRPLSLTRAITLPMAKHILKRLNELALDVEADFFDGKQGAVEAVSWMIDTGMNDYECEKDAARRRRAAKRPAPTRRPV